MNRLCLLFLLISTAVFGAPPFFTTFTPPEKWLIADPLKLEKPIQIGFVESSKKIFSPSLTLSYEKIGKTTLKTYLAAVKKNYAADWTSTCQELGTLNTSLGKASLLQIEMKNAWGNVTLLQAISLYEGFALIQTAACLQEDFLRLHETFLNSFKSLTVYPSLVGSIDNPTFATKIATLRNCWEKHTATSKDDPHDLFTSPFFQNNQWKPFVSYIEGELKDQGPCWQFLAIRHLKESLLEKIP